MHSLPLDFKQSSTQWSLTHFLASHVLHAADKPCDGMPILRTRCLPHPAPSVSFADRERGQHASDAARGADGAAWRCSGGGLLYGGGLRLMPVSLFCCGGGQRHDKCGRMVEGQLKVYSVLVRDSKGTYVESTSLMGDCAVMPGCCICFILCLQRACRISFSSSCMGRVWCDDTLVTCAVVPGMCLVTHSKCS